MIKVKIKRLLRLMCPAATQDLKLNTKNRDASIKAEHIQYGPLNVDEPGDYWEQIADYWNTDEKAAKKSLCGNCVAFDISPRMDKCMPGPVSDKDGRLGYCWMHHFKCHSLRSCHTWAKGGPIDEDETSYEWAERNKQEKEPEKLAAGYVGEAQTVYAIIRKSDGQVLQKFDNFREAERELVRSRGYDLKTHYVKSMLDPQQAKAEKDPTLAGHPK